VGQISSDQLSPDRFFAHSYDVLTLDPGQGIYIYIYMNIWELIFIRNRSNDHAVGQAINSNWAQVLFYCFTGHLCVCDATEPSWVIPFVVPEYSRIRIGMV
jgi:hypothetical protein